MQIKINFTLTREQFPKKSGKYLCAISFDNETISYFTSLDFSAKHNVFNAHDHEIEPASGFAPEDVLWWADVNEIRYELGEIGV